MIRDYVQIMRTDHWFKNVFMLPGIILGYLALDSPPADFVRAALHLAVGVFAVCLVCSSNYTINEILDAPTDRKHPEKRNRPAAAGRIKPLWGYLQWLVLGAAGLGLAFFVGIEFFLVAVSLLVMGLAYNVRPLRTKERAYLDVLSESVNNPIRLLLGWYAVGCVLIPPASLLLSYWMLGAYFMAIKRLAELRHIGDRKMAAEYRTSFGYYTQERLLMSIMFYSTAFALFLGVFLIRYKVELILGVPFLAGFMAIYLRIGFFPNSPVQHPEKLYKNKYLTASAIVTLAVILFCLIVRIPILERIFQTTIPGGFRP